MKWLREKFAAAVICAILRSIAVAALAMAPALAADTQTGRVASAPSTSQADCLFAWAEASYPSYLAPVGSGSLSFPPYYYRYYPQTNAYLGVSFADEHLYYLGPLSQNALLDLGPYSGLFEQAKCVTITRPLNDTGIVLFGNATSNSLTSEPGDFPGQDARYGRDAQAAVGQLVKVGGGSKGFDLTKIGNDGSVLSATAELGTGAKDWACTRDNVTGLTWEVKTASGLRSQNHTYTWYNSDAASNGGSAGTASSGSCFASGRCDTEKFVQDVNSAGLCGHSDWRMPSEDELMSIVDYGRYYPAIDAEWFPNTPASYFWSASALAGNSGGAWGVSFYYGYDYGGSLKSDASRVRLVRAGQ